jgi:lipoprotein-anchoring transpeptidase ErfK/SrfK
MTPVPRTRRVPPLWASATTPPPARGARAELPPEVRARRRRQARRRGAVLAVIAVAGLVSVATTSSAVVTGSGERQPGAVSARETGAVLQTDVPTASSSAVQVPSPTSMPTPAAHAAAWAPVRHRTVARRAPGGAAIARIATRTPEGTTNLLEVIGRSRDAAGRLWAHVRLAVLPNGTTGWVPRSAVGGITTVRTHLFIDLRTRTATLMRGDRMVMRVPVGIGRPGASTPTGRFYVRNRLTTYRGGTYGPVAFGTSARSADLTDWPAGGFIGIHGTDRPDLIPGRVSHGCIRMRNPDILRLARSMPIGTPVTIRP